MMFEIITMNQVENISISGYPTFYFYVNGRKDVPYEYQGELTVDKLWDTIRAYTSYDWPNEDEDDILDIP